MAVAANQVVSRRGRDGKIKGLGVAAGVHVFEGTLLYKDASGFATDVKVDANTVFLGVAREEVDNTAGANGERHVEFWSDGEFTLPSSGLTAADVGVDLHGSDNFTTTKTGAGNPRVGVITEFLSDTQCRAEIKGLGEA